MNLNVNEIFYSVQGEGVLVGMPSVFLRLQGCNLKCSWCDSKFTWNVKEEPVNSYRVYTTFAVAEKLSSYTCNNIVITGGEPLLQHDAVYELIGRFKDYHFTIETNGTLDPHPDLFDAVDLWMVSPKKDQTLSTMFFGDFIEPKVFYKFVVDRDGMEWIDKYIKDWELEREYIMLMAEGAYMWQQFEHLPKVIEFAKERCYRVSPRMHITAYGNKRGV